MAERKPLSIRFSEAELAELRQAAAIDPSGGRWSSQRRSLGAFVRRAALARGKSLLQQRNTFEASAESPAASSSSSSSSACLSERNTRRCALVPDGGGD